MYTGIGLAAGGAGGFLLGHCVNAFNNFPMTQFVKNLPYKIKDIGNNVMNKICYKPSINKLRKSATSIENFGDYKKLFIMYHASDPIIFNKNLRIEEIKEILIKQNLVSEYNYVMFENMNHAFKTLRELNGRNIKAYLGHGGFSYAFLLDNNMVLKITRNDIIDKKVFSRNIRNAFNTDLEVPTNQIGIVNDRIYSIQEFGIPTTNKTAFNLLTNNLKNKGFKFDIDWEVRQCARFRDTRKTFWGRKEKRQLCKAVDQ